MLRVRCLSRHLALQPCNPALPLDCCRFSSSSTTAESSARPSAPSRRTRSGGRTHFPRVNNAPATPDDDSGRHEEKPSLIEQLFPEESKRYDEQQRALREVPRLPLHAPLVKGTLMRKTARSNLSDAKSHTARRLQKEIEATEEGTSVLVLRNASTNLIEEDFRRLIPQGRHIEGWTLDQGDILKVIPGRDLTTLAQQNVYYLLFSSPLHAFTYQSHVTRIHKLATLHTPTSASSAIPPPPGYIIEGLDVHAALEAYALIPPTQLLELRQLKPPLSPLMQSLVWNQGYSAILKRKDKMPFEVRMTMDGPQLGPSTVRHIMMETGKARALSWSGGDNMNLSITRWEPIRTPSPQNDTVFARYGVGREVGSEGDPRESTQPGRSDQHHDQTTHKVRPAPVVYIIGFHTEKAAQSFVQYWHRRPLEVANDKFAQEAEGDVPPVATVELLW